jgi:transcriptional regulator with XRE-family HTH domain
MDSDNFLFDLLPVRPRVEAHESLTSFLLRLTIANGYQTTSNLWMHLLGQGCHFQVRTLDYPPPALRAVLRALSHGEEDMLGATFHYLLPHLGIRKVTTRSLTGFLRGSIGYTLRYCPICLAERQMHQLTWRFLALRGCSKHQCALHECCDHCGDALPLLSTPDSFGYCPSCGMALSAACMIPLRGLELEKTRFIEHELRSWLSPVKWSEAEYPSNATDLGAKISALRKQRGLSRSDVANSLHTWIDRIDAIESGPVDRSRLRDFLAYMSLLNVSINELSPFSLVPPNQDCRLVPISEISTVNGTDAPLYFCQRSANRPSVDYEEDRRFSLCKERYSDENIASEDEFWLKRINNAVLQTSIAGEALSQQRVLEHLGARRETIASFPQALALLERIGRASYRSTDQVLSNQVQGLLDAMRMLGMQPTGSKIGELLQVSLSTLTYYPSVNRLLNNECSFSETDDQLHQHYLADQIVIASRVLASMGHQVTVQSICRGISCPLPNLLCYPFIRVLLESIAEDFEHIENRSYESFEIDKIRTLLLCANEAQSDTCNLRRTALLDHLKLSEHDLLQYPNVRIAMEYILTSMWRLENGSAQRVEQSVVDAIHNIVSDLRQQGRAVSDKRIRAGLIERRFYLNRFPRARSTLRQVLAAEKLSCYEGSEHVAEDPVNRIAVPPENKPRRRKRLSFAEREKHYQQLTRSAIEELKRLNQPITMKAICAIASMGKNLCYRYPSIMEMVETSRREDSSSVGGLFSR